MATRRTLFAIVLLAAALHGVGIARSILPAQDGLKFLRVARGFQTLPWADVVRGTDQHPLYPALVALAEPCVRLLSGRGPTTWRIAGQLVAALASIAMLFPLHSLTRRLFNDHVANLAALGCVLLPLPMAVGHDTLSDSLALFGCVLSLRLGLATIVSGHWRPAIGCGLAAGLGFLARPEVLVAPVAVVGIGCLIRVGSAVRTKSYDANGPPSGPYAEGKGLTPKLAGLAFVFLAMVGSYALIKGEVSEKLAMRRSGAHRAGPKNMRDAHQWLPKGLDDPHWDFSPKEESAAPVRRGLGEVSRELALQWADGLSAVFAFFALWGLVRDRHIREIIAEGDQRPDSSNVARMVVGTYLSLFTLVLARHELRMGYLSDRHTLTLVILALPWTAAGIFVCAKKLAAIPGLSSRSKRAAGIALLILALCSGIHFQLKPAHASRWGHYSAGTWLANHARKGEAVLDTRGWSSFISGLPAYDYWHVRQAFTDSNLAYVVVGDDELKASSRRSETLRAVLAYAAEPVVSFPSKKGGTDVGVRVYRYHRPESWEGLSP